jgi:hypothetical protein
MPLPDEARRTVQPPGARFPAASVVGILNSAVSLLPGIMHPTAANAGRRDGMPAADAGAPGQAVGSGPVPLPSSMVREREAPLPVRRVAGRISMGERTGLHPETTGQSRPVLGQGRDAPPLTRSRTRGRDLELLMPAIEQAVARRVDKALKAPRRTSPPPRSSTGEGRTASGIDSDRTARQLAERIRRLAQDDRFRRGRLR